MAILLLHKSTSGWHNDLGRLLSFEVGRAEAKVGELERDPQTLGSVGHSTFSSIHHLPSSGPGMGRGGASLGFSTDYRDVNNFFRILCLIHNLAVLH